MPSDCPDHPIVAHRGRACTWPSMRPPLETCGTVRVGTHAKAKRAGNSCFAAHRFD
jgi:hypothetical protein